MQLFVYWHSLHYFFASDYAALFDSFHAALPLPRQTTSQTIAALSYPCHLENQKVFSESEIVSFLH